MNWRTRVAVAASLLLLLPLAFAVGLALSGPRGSRTPEASEVSPVLAPDERRQLLSYGRLCQTPNDCDPPLGCLSPITGGRSICLDSNCMTDLQCQESFTCKTVQPLGGSPLLRRCVLQGSAQEGELCIEYSNAKADVCAPGLVCNGYCGRPCQPEQPSNCPEGFFCGEGQNGPSCHPTCEGRTCPEGQHCIRYGSSLSVCAEIRGANCHERPCPENQRCIKMNSSANKKAIWMECVVPCDESTPCPTGSVCDGSACRRRCRPDAPDTCGPGLKCTEYPVEKLWLCSMPLD